MERMTYFEVAIKVLEEADGGPLHINEITKRATQIGYIDPKGLTPAATIASKLYVHINECKENGQEPKIRLTGKAQFALSRKSQHRFIKLAEESRSSIRDELFKLLDELQKQPMSLKEAHSFLKKTLSVAWETPIQTKYRLYWLENTGEIKKIGEKYRIY